MLSIRTKNPKQNVIISAISFSYVLDRCSDGYAMRYIKAIYRAGNQAQAQAFQSKWIGKYDQAIHSGDENWDNLAAFLEYPTAIRKLIYTTNIIESFNSTLRKYTKNKKVFPNDQSAVKSIYLAAQQIQKKWQKKGRGWTKVYNLYICFEDRIK